jgi:hypothetical protein
MICGSGGFKEMQIGLDIHTLNCTCSFILLSSCDFI